MTHKIHNIGVASQIGKYSDAIEAAPGRTLFLSGTPGLAPDGNLPDTFEAQAEQAWKNVLALLQKPTWAPSTSSKFPNIFSAPKTSAPTPPSAPNI